MPQTSSPPDRDWHRAARCAEATRAAGPVELEVWSPRRWATLAKWAIYACSSRVQQYERDKWYDTTAPHSQPKASRRGCRAKAPARNPPRHKSPTQAATRSTAGRHQGSAPARHRTRSSWMTLAERYHKKVPATTPRSPSTTAKPTTASPGVSFAAEETHEQHWESVTS